MAVAFDAVTLANATSDISATHTPVGTPKGVAILIVQDANTADVVTAVSYGGVALARVDTQTETTGDVGRVYVYYLGAGVPSGAQTFVVDQSSILAINAWCVTVTAAADTEIAASEGANGDTANPTVTIPTLTGYDGLVLAALFSGVSAVGSTAPGSGYTTLTGHDFGANIGTAMRGAKSGANVVADYIVGVDDWALVGMAIQEVVAPPSGPPAGSLMLLGVGR